MITPNMHYNELKNSYLFYNIAQKTNAYIKENPGTHLLRLGIGDVTLPLCDAVIRALHKAVDDQASKRLLTDITPAGISSSKQMKYSLQAEQATSWATYSTCFLQIIRR